MKKTILKKTLVALLSVIIALISALPCSALEINSCSHESCECPQIEFVFSNEKIDSEISEKIINKLSGTSSDASTYGIMCTLFGHKYESAEYVTAITHKARASAPRCLSEEYRCRICSRCDDVEETLIASEYIYCCE